MKSSGLPKCQICDKPAHGFHHGALTCRACSAFFRRSGGVDHGWKCGKGDECDQFSCKKCRMEKCLRIGMNCRNFQFDRDSFSSLVSNTKTPLPMSLEKFLGRPYVIIRCEPKPSITKRTFIDLSGLLEKGSKILSKNHHEMPYSGIEKLAVHMRNERSVQIHGNKNYQKIGPNEARMFWELEFCQTADWLSHFDEFQELSISLKMEFLKSMWTLWGAVEKIFRTIENYSKSFGDGDYNLSLDKTTLVDIGKLEYDLSWCTEYDVDKLGYFLDTHSEFKYLKRFAKILKSLEPTDVEQTFFVLHTCLSYAGKFNQGEVLKVSEKLLENASNEMHDYYVTVLKMPNYAGRLAKLMKCDRIIKEYVASLKQKIDIGKTFDIFHLQFSHPEMFTVFGF